MLVTHYTILSPILGPICFPNWTQESICPNTSQVCGVNTIHSCSLLIQSLLKLYRNWIGLPPLKLLQQPMRKNRPGSIGNRMLCTLIVTNMAMKTNKKSQAEYRKRRAACSTEAATQMTAHASCKTCHNLHNRRVKEKMWAPHLLSF